jgi:16S rRNA (guanine(966)-N(2))-methyltransferase RsmD
MKSHKQKNLRPTTGKVREALFDILRGKIEGARFLDLYAGTGAVGMNALGEGAAHVVFVEESRVYAKKLDELVIKNRASDKTKIITKKVTTYIEWADLNDITFDIIYLDPPYHRDEILPALNAIGRSHILNPEGIVIAEHFSKVALPDKFDSLCKIKDYTYGDTVLSFYEAR